MNKTVKRVLGAIGKALLSHHTEEVIGTMRHENQLLMAYLRFAALKDGVLEFPFEDRMMRFYVPQGDVDHIQYELIRWRTFFEINSLQYVRNKYDLKRKIVVDAGANIGNHTVFFSKVCGAAECHAFEPNPVTVEILRRNIAENQLEGVTVHECGLSDRSANIAVTHFDVRNIGGTSFSEVTDGGIPAVSLDSLNLSSIDFLKIDVEGMATKVLRGARETIARTEPIIMIELFPHEISHGAAELTNMGYVPVHQLDRDNFIYEPKRQ